MIYSEPVSSTAVCCVSRTAKSRVSTFWVKAAAVILAAAAALWIAAIAPSAASFYLETNNVNIAAGETAVVNVRGSVSLKVASDCSSVKGEYIPDTGSVLITAKDFGAAVLTVYNTENTKDRDMIYVTSQPASVGGSFKKLGRYYSRFKLSSGGYAKGWFSPDGSGAYYAYPNGITELYTGPIMYKNKLYFLSEGRFSGEVFDAYIFEVFNNNMPIPENCAEFYSQAASRYGAENVTLERTDSAIVVTAQSYVPGFPWGAKGKYYFEGDTPSEDFTEHLSEYTFSDKVTYHLGGNSEAMYKSTMKSLYVRKALYDAFGKNCKAYKSKSGTIIYRWTSVGKEKAVVDLVIGSDSLDFTICLK